ncbi:prephenate dehydrogenase/arogenate dehydrogenase family protein [Flammeovirgaceae bacterium SG7u.111]|nr:prephenate dehydrogenase/arogenate dehydrogenase family protein [Flammeovirgaceae bacterium SG7u.132]WPO36120.1 prephenate dehydrogenase/arogenate dehydrogenase family protein [Flammeovirgaceae bacterium SG7u.111]
MHLEKLKVGVIGGRRGLGSWLVKYFADKGFEVYFSSRSDTSIIKNNIDLVQKTDLIFLSVPIQNMEGVLEEIFPYLDGKHLVEVCSVKKFLVDKYQSLKGDYPDINTHFYSIHPMFSQRIRTLKGQVILFNYASKDDGSLMPELWDIFASNEATLYDLDYITHDKVMGVVQGLNHFNIFVSAKTLARMSPQIGKIKDYSSPPYRIFLIFFSRYVLQDPGLYADIQMYNEFVPEVLGIFKEEVDKLFDVIQTKDRDTFIKYVESSRFYFEENEEDMGISNHLIEQLGRYINKLKKEKE